MNGRNDIKYWGDKFRAAHGNSVRAILAQGAVVYEALEAEGITQQAYADEIGRSRPAVAQFKAIGAAEGRLVTASNNLPPSWRAVYECTLLTDEQLALVTPEMGQVDIKSLRGAHNHLAQGTGDNEWYTPIEYVDAAREVMGGIDLDPASCGFAQERIKATEYFTSDDDGLLQEWHGRVWLNPPYSKELIGQFVHKLGEEFGAGRVSQAIMLTHNYTDTAWFHEAEAGAAGICFTRGRIAFESPNKESASPTQGSAFFYYGDFLEAFVNRFLGIGFVR